MLTLGNPESAYVESTQSGLLMEELKFQISQNYFSDILNAQLVIFAVIVGALAVFSWIFQYRISKGTIKKEVVRATKHLRKKMNQRYGRNLKKLDTQISERFLGLESNVGVTKGEVYRSMGLFWDSQKSYSVAFIWWIRAAYEFFMIVDESLTRICLNNAQASVSKITSVAQITDSIGEYQKTTSKIDGKLYKMEKDQLDSAVKAALEKTIT